MTRTPPAKFAKLPCRASPTAKPAAASTATNEVVFTPTISTTEIMSMIFNSVLINPARKGIRVRSTLSFSMTFRRNLEKELIIIIPTTSMTMARTSFGPHVISNWMAYAV